MQPFFYPNWFSDMSIEDLSKETIRDLNKIRYKYIYEKSSTPLMGLQYPVNFLVELGDEK